MRFFTKCAYGEERSFSSDPLFSFPPVHDVHSIQSEESKALVEAIQTYLKTDIVDEDASMSEDQVLDVDGLIREWVSERDLTRSHKADELTYLLKIILGLAMKCSNNKEYISRVTSLPKSTQEVLMYVIKEVLSTMSPSEGEGALPASPDELVFRDFDSMLQEENVETPEDDWGDWDDEATPSSAAVSSSPVPGAAEMAGAFHSLR